jgi:hypothetical protein
MSKPKAQGTAFETWLVNWLLKVRGVETAYRLHEGGKYDEGDVRFVDGYGTEWTVECKARQNLNVTQALSKARLKSGDGVHTVLAWKKLTRTKPDAKRRTPDGEPVVIIMGLDTFHALVGGYPDD